MVPSCNTSITESLASRVSLISRDDEDGIIGPSAIMNATVAGFLQCFFTTSDLRASLAYTREETCPFGMATAEDSRRGGEPRTMVVAGPPPAYEMLQASSVRDPTWRMGSGIHGGVRCWMERFNHNLGTLLH
jgi:hypothetical protein